MVASGRTGVVDGISPPVARRRGWVVRSRLLARIQDAEADASGPVVMVSAPAGFGKSVLARQWLDLDDRAHLELALGPGLDDPASLGRVLVDLLEHVGPRAPDVRANLGGAEPRFSAILLPLLARLVRSRDRDYVLVVDDVHLVRSPAGRELLRTVCEAVPPGSQVILLGREVSPSWLARVRVEGRLLEITEEDLRFGTEDAVELFHDMGVPADDTEAAAVVATTTGWAVALYLVALALQRDRGLRPSGVVTDDRDIRRFIHDYIWSQVLAPMDPALRVFLTRTSVLDDVDPALCDAVLERRDSAALIELTRERLRLLVTPDPGTDRVRYHHLLRDTLVAELTRTAPAEIPELCSRASRWYAEVGDLDSAIRYAKAADDLAEVGRLVWSTAGVLIAAGQTDRLAGWLGDLTEEQVAHDRWLTLTAAWVALESGEPDVMDRWILRAEGHAGAGWRVVADHDPYAAALAVIVGLVGRGGLDDIAELCSAAVRGLPPDSPFLAAAQFLRGVALTLNRDVEQGQQCLVEADRLARVLQVPIIQADSLSWRGLLAIASDDQPGGQRLILRAHEIIREHRLERLATAAHCFTAQALVLALLHDPSAATMLATARRLTIQVNEIVPWFSVCGRLVQARAAVALGDGATARQLISEARARMTPEIEATLAQDLLADAEGSLRLLRVDGMTPAALTSAELRVLQFLPSHRQLPQIAEQLVVSANTVKSQVTAIYRKLGVSSRDEAVSRARELGLLEAPAPD